jgi:hypothetical protein
MASFIMLSLTPCLERMDLRTASTAEGRARAQIRREWSDQALEPEAVQDGTARVRASLVQDNSSRGAMMRARA